MPGTVQDNIGVITMLPLAGPSGFYMQSTIVIVIVIVSTVGAYNQTK